MVRRPATPLIASRRDYSFCRRLDVLPGNRASLNGLGEVQNAARGIREKRFPRPRIIAMPAISYGLLLALQPACGWSSDVLVVAAVAFAVVFRVVMPWPASQNKTTNRCIVDIAQQ
jgi:hypothetical protein